MRICFYPKADAVLVSALAGQVQRCALERVRHVEGLGPRKVRILPPGPLLLREAVQGPVEEVVLGLSELNLSNCLIASWQILGHSFPAVAKNVDKS